MPLVKEVKTRMLIMEIITRTVITKRSLAV